MPVTLINPNSTSAMTDAMLDAARVAAPGLEIDGWTSQDGPPSIQGASDGDLAAGPLLTLIDKAAAAGTDGVIIGCFDDTALEEAARRVACPVIGIGQAAFHFCALRNWRFSVVTTLSVSVPVIEDNLARYGLLGHTARVRASEVPVLALETDRDASAKAILAEARKAVEEDGIDAVILGCAGMVHVTQLLREALPVPVVDPVTAASTAMVWVEASANG